MMHAKIGVYKMPARRLATKVKEENGSYKKDPQRKNLREPSSSKSEPKQPDHLCESAKKIWKQTCEILREMGMLSKTDSHLIEHYSICYAEYLKLYEIVQQKGHISDSGNSVGPASTAMTRLASEHIKLVNELGLTPASRGKLTLPEGEDKKKQAASLASIVESMKRNE